MILELSFNNRDEFEEYFFGPYAEKEFIFDSIFNGIKEAIRLDKEVTTFAKVHFKGDPVPVYLDIPKDNWIDSLENALRFYEKNDLFEKCIDVSNTIKSIF